MPSDDLSDDAVAAILKQEAKDNRSRYSAFGFGTLFSTRSNDRAPKANTRFLRNIIRETDSHNAALLAKEKAESRARLKALRQAKDDTDREYGSEGERRHRKRRRVNERSPSRTPSRNRKDSHGDRPKRSLSQDRRRSRAGHRHHGHSDEEDERRSKRRHRRESRRHGRARSQEGVESEENSSHRSRHRRSRAESTSPYDYFSDFEDQSLSRKGNLEDAAIAPARENGRKKPAQSIHKRKSRGDTMNGYSKKRDCSRSAESDPLEGLLGPIHQPPPKVRGRGRGTFSSSAMDAHFEADYDPSADAKPDSDLDSWDDAVEAYRDRLKWRRQGANRLRAAGFTEEQVRSWEKGGEKTEQDVQWSKKGEGREWDRGKVVDEDGDVDLKPEWGRLKDT